MVAVFRIAGLAAFIVDVALKVAARMNPDVLGRFSLSTSVGVMGFSPSVNDALAFSLPVPNAVIWPIGWTVVATLIVSGVRCQVSGVRLAILAIVLGALSNLTDRTFLGGVTDYLSFTNLFPAFNIADLLILSGVIGWVTTTRRTASASEGGHW